LGIVSIFPGQVGYEPHKVQTLDLDNKILFRSKKENTKRENKKNKEVKNGDS